MSLKVVTPWKRGPLEDNSRTWQRNNLEIDYWMMAYVTEHLISGVISWGAWNSATPAADNAFEDGAHIGAPATSVRRMCDDMLKKSGYYLL